MLLDHRGHHDHGHRFIGAAGRRQGDGRHALVRRVVGVQHERLTQRAGGQQVADGDQLAAGDRCHRADRRIPGQAVGRGRQLADADDVVRHGGRRDDGVGRRQLDEPGGCDPAAAGLGPHRSGHWRCGPGLLAVNDQHRYRRGDHDRDQPDADCIEKFTFHRLLLLYGFTSAILRSRSRPSNQTPRGSNPWVYACVFIVTTALPSFRAASIIAMPRRQVTSCWNRTCSLWAISIAPSMPKK